MSFLIKLVGHVFPLYKYYECICNGSEESVFTKIVNSKII
jgi:hypothetical protein